ncbi:hypothetical protein M9979_10160 [Sphingomonas sp. RP10(2022)]|uniref:Uncharacterized protein n=1 Tax=Sphingomonas liriopis TaxID=2949094 RepID=A0A9X2HST2_9SPHN|nr:hypothetical protein [Sphingomonas liriopis]MCP3735232.1 hypothetical protein [Sphingomonas liriopis]
MTHVITFNIVLFAACALAFRLGGAPERYTALVFLIGSAATFLLPFEPHESFHSVDMLALGVDLGVLLGLVGIALYADRFWPLYVSALHVITIAIHGVKGFAPDLVPWMYAGASGKIAYPMLALLAIGALRHRRRIATFGSDRDWSLHRPDIERP